MGLKLKWNSPVILTFALVCTTVFVADMLMMGKLMPVFTVYPSVDWSNPFSLASLVTHVFGHANLEHLLGNLTFILLLGPIIEEKYGSKSFINVLFFDTGLMGASGIVFMLILLVSFTNVSSGEIPVTFILVALLFIGKNYYKV